MKLEALNKKSVKSVLRLLDKQFGYSGNLDYVFLKSQKGRIYIVNRTVMEFPINKLRIDTIGLYFGELRHDELRLTLDGCQIIGPECSKGIVRVQRKHAKEWMKGEDLLLDSGLDNQFVLIKYQDDFLGCGKQKEGKILNYLSKSRKMQVFI